MWSIDLTEVYYWGLCKIYVLVAIDHFSRKVLAVTPLEGPNAGFVINALEMALENIGKPKHIISDQVSVFTNAAFREFLDLNGVKIRYGAVGEHGSIAVTERVIETLKYELLLNVKTWLHRTGIFNKLNLDEIALKDHYFILDDTIFSKRGKQLENISFVRDHTMAKSVLGYCTVVLTLFTDNGVYPLDFAYRFGKKRNPKSKAEIFGSPKSPFGQRSYEAKHQTKLESGKSMIERALKQGVIHGYDLFDSWYAHPSFIKRS